MELSMLTLRKRLQKFWEEDGKPEGKSPEDFIASVEIEEGREKLTELMDRNEANQ